ncbi:MAG: acetyltransferase [Verrucomicrobiota bacterium]
MGFLDDAVSSPHVIGTLEDLKSRVATEGVTDFAVAIGDNWTRRAVFCKTRSIFPDHGYPALVHPAAVIARGVDIGPGSVVLAGAVINSGVRVGRGCLLNTLSSLDHDSIMADYSALAPHAGTGGHVVMGECSSLLMGAQVIHGVKIGAHTVIGAGATVLEDMPARSVAVGTPARVIKTRMEDTPYLS